MAQTEASRYDAIIIGAGQAGMPLSTALAKAGRSTALIEREHVGGACINNACTPTKTMAASARVAYLARRAHDYGVDAGPVSVDQVRVRQRKQAVVDSFRGGDERRIERTERLDLIRGEARFTGPRSLDVRLPNGQVQQLTSDLIFINCGSRPAQPPIPGLDTVTALDSTSVMELDATPEHLLVLGGGYVGLEFGQMFRRFGSQVTIVERGPQLLEREDADVGEEIAKILREDGIEIILEAQAIGVQQARGGLIELTIQTKDGQRPLAASHLLVATGRRPNTDWLDLPAAAVETDERGYIRVNERLETNVPGVYALGEVNGDPAFTHMAYDDYRIIRANLLEGGSATTTGRLVPYAVFTDPQLGRVGLSEKEARAQGLRIRVGKMPMSWIARALEVDEPRGLMKAVVDAETDRILGCAVLGIEGGELMAMLEIAMVGQVPASVLREAIFAHPTLAESLNNLFGNLQE